MFLVPDKFINVSLSNSYFCLFVATTDVHCIKSLLFIVEICRFVRTCHGSGCSTVSEHLVFCGFSHGCVCTEKYGVHLRRSLFSHQRFEAE